MSTMAETLRALACEAREPPWSILGATLLAGWLAGQVAPAWEAGAKPGTMGVETATGPAREEDTEDAGR